MQKKKSKLLLYILARKFKCLRFVAALVAIRNLAKKLHSSKAVQISLQFNELFEKKFKILTSEIFTINFQKTCWDTLFFKKSPYLTYRLQIFFHGSLHFQKAKKIFLLSYPNLWGFMYPSVISRLCFALSEEL